MSATPTMRPATRRRDDSWRRLLLIAGLSAAGLLAGASCCPPFCRKPPDPPKPDEKHTHPGPHAVALSSPTVDVPLYDCGGNVTVEGFAPGATIDIYANGTTRIGGGTGGGSWEATFSVSPALAAGQAITATQSLDGVVSPHSASVAVTSYFAAHPEGLPKPTVTSPAYQCGRALWVENLVEGGAVKVFEDTSHVGSRNVSHSWAWVGVNPAFTTGRQITATHQLCTSTSPVSDPVMVQDAPSTLDPPTLNSLYEGGTSIQVVGITHGAKLTIMEGTTVLASVYSPGIGHRVGLNPAPAEGAALTATQELCGVVSAPSNPTIVKSCSELPAPAIAPTCLGATTVRLAGAQPGARVQVFADGTLIADGGGPVVNLLRPLVAGDTLTAKQWLGSCASPTSAAFEVTSIVCSIPGFQPSFWNDGSAQQGANSWNVGGLVQGSNNCYNYGNNKRTDTYAQPGRAAGVPHSAMSCRDVHDAARADGLRPVSRSEKCPCNEAKVALVVWPEVDYHWYRQDADGTWSHKMGGFPAGNLDNAGATIADPETAERDAYTHFCGYFCSCSDRVEGAGHELIE